MDARVLAVLVADPRAVSRKTLESWVKATKYYVPVDLIAKLASRCPFADALRDKWRMSSADFGGQAGWDIVAEEAANGTASDEYFSACLGEIERDIPNAKNRTRHSMNGALIAIGDYCQKLRARALAAAKRIGRVEVDHGQTGCKTPAAALYIQRMVAHQKARFAAAKPGKKSSAPSGGKSRATPSRSQKQGAVRRTRTAAS